MNYRELTDLMEITCHGSANVNWGAFGSLAKIYSTEHVARCILLLPEHMIRKLDKTKLVAYLHGICKSKATVNDYKKIKEKTINVDKLGQL